MKIAVIFTKILQDLYRVQGTANMKFLIRVRIRTLNKIGDFLPLPNEGRNYFILPMFNTTFFAVVMLVQCILQLTLATFQLQGLQLNRL